jgi:hypothetical protein
MISRKIENAYKRGGVPEVILGAWRTLAQEFYSVEQSMLCSERGLRLYTLMRLIESHRYVSLLVSRGVGTDIRTSNLYAEKSSDTLFILGSGASVNEINKKGWDHISGHDSFGLNKWPLHDFVPTYYMFELRSGDDNQRYRDWYWDILDCKKEQYSNIPIILKDVSPHTYYHLLSDPYPGWLSGSIILAPTIKIPINKGKEDSTFRNMRNSEYMRAKNSIQYLYQTSASIITLILLAVKIGYKSIILCGVDLNNSKYFFDDEQLIYEEADIPFPDFLTDRNRDPEDPHKTADEQAKQITVDELIYSIERIILNPRGISLFIENKESALYPGLSHYNIKAHV